MKRKTIFLSLLLFSVAFIVFLSISIIPKNSIVKTIVDGEIVIEQTKSSILVMKGSERVKTYNTGKSFTIEDYFYAKNRNEKFLKNNFSFSVMFPDEKICASDTALLFNQIRAHAYICMQKATNLINQDFYYNNKPFPEVFENLLNQERGKLLENLYFTDVRISKINYEQKYNLDVMTTLYLSNTAFLMESALYQELALNEDELKSYNNTLLTNYLNNLNIN